MLRYRRPVFVESKKGRFRVPFKMPESANPVDVSLRLRERGWTPYKVFFDTQSQAWIAFVIDVLASDDPVRRAPAAPEDVNNRAPGQGARRASQGRVRSVRADDIEAP
jgi:hypothetical protein